MRAEQRAAQQRHGVGIGAALVHPTVWLLGLIMFACQTGSYGLTLWIPQIVRGLSGYQRLDGQHDLGAAVRRGGRRHGR